MAVDVKTYFKIKHCSSGYFSNGASTASKIRFVNKDVSKKWLVKQTLEKHVKSLWNTDVYYNCDIIEYNVETHDVIKVISAITLFNDVNNK